MNLKRDIELFRLVLNGTTLEAAGATTNIGRECTRQICLKLRRKIMLIANGTEEAEVNYSAILKDMRDNKDFWLHWLLELEKPTGPDLKITLESDLAYIGLSARAVNSLLFDNIKTVGQLIEVTENDIRRIPNLGKVTFDEIKSTLAKYKYSLQPLRGIRE